jgi:signal peptidase I
MLLKSKTDTYRTYRLEVPFKGKIIDINAANRTAYEQIILSEQGHKATIKNGRLFVNGKELSRYTFEDDYYWVLSDNPENTSDSRSLGFIPFRNIIGKARYIWYNSNNGSIRKERCFSTIN